MPERVGRYDVVLPLRTDDRGAAYLARASGLGGFDRFVVLEIAAKAFQDRDDFSKLAIDEATRIANLRHTNVVPVYDVGEDGAAGVFLVTEYVPGTTLADLKGAPKDVALRILVDALAGLHAAHEHADEEGRSFNLIHGDVAPSSVVVGTDGIARIADLPLARAARRASKPLGDRFASPERVRGDDLDRRADVWSAGVIAWEILTGSTFAATDASDPPRVKSVEGAGGIADEIDAAVFGALKNDKAERTATCAAFAKELSAAARAAGMFAEVERVAEHVKTVAAPDLAKRREKLKEPAKKEEEEKKPTMIGVSAAKADAPDDTTGEQKADAKADEKTDDKAGPKAPRPLSLPEVPGAPLKVVDSPISVLALEVDLSAYRGDRANTAVFGAVATSEGDAEPAAAKAEAPREPEEKEEIYRSPVAAGPSTGTASGRSLLGGPLAKHEKIALGIGGGLLVIALGIGIARCTQSSSSGPAAAASGSASGSAALASGSPAGSAAAPARAGMLTVRANGTISKVAIGDRTIEVLEDETAEVELTPAERTKTLKVSVTSVEGRVATATVDPGVRGIEVLFGDRDTLPPPPPPPGGSAAHVAGGTATHTATPTGGGGGSGGGKRTWPKRGPRK